MHNSSEGARNDAHKLTDGQIEELAFAVLQQHNDDRLWSALTYGNGPYEVLKPTTALCRLARVFFGAGVSAANGEREKFRALAEDFQEYLYRVAAQVPFEHAQWAQERGAALLKALKS